MITDLTDTLLPPSATMREAIRSINDSRAHVVLVIDELARLVGTVTDGDVRRGILRGLDLDAPVSKIMNSSPVVATARERKAVIRQLMETKVLRHIPVLGESGEVLGIETLESVVAVDTRDNLVLLMAGGFGTRLHPLTDSCPKPLLSVGGKPILERILDGLIESGFRRFFVSVHYRGEAIKAHFGDGARWGVEIRYVEEAEPLGTAGALGLLPEKPSKPVLMMNGDLLTKVSFEELLEFHGQHRAACTMCIREYEFQVPYGTVDFAEHRLLRIVEKPTHTFFVNAGIYVLSPEVVRLVSPGTRTDMPELLKRVRREVGDIAVFPIHEYWLDVGRMGDFERARRDVGK